MSSSSSGIQPPGSSSQSQSSSSSDPCNGNTFQIREKITDLPIVSTDQNGTGLQYRRREVFDTYGRLIWSMDPRGYITRSVYDPATGAMIRRIDDVDTDELTGVPTGWSTPNDGGLNLVTDYENDSQGRTLRELGPAHEAQLRVDDCTIEVAWLRTVQFTVYRDDIRETWSASGYARGFGPNYTYVTVGSVRIDRRNYNGQTTDQIEAVRACACGPLSSEEEFPQESWRRWTHNIYDQWGRLQASRVYYKIPESGEGEEGVNYNQTRYAYDALGRQNKMVSPGGTITRTVFDSQNRAIQQWVGTDDTGATDDDPSGGGATGNNMVEVSSKEFDEGVGGGDGNLTSETRYVGPANSSSSSSGSPGSDNRTTNYSYDYRSRLEDTETTPDGGTTKFITHNDYDNLDRVTGVDTYHTSTVAGNLTGRTLSYYDSQGRVFKTENYAVDPDTGTVGNALVGENWFDAAGNTVKSTQPGSRAISAFAYDSLGRQTMNYLAYGEPDSSSSSSTPGSSESSSSSPSGGGNSSSSSSSSSQGGPGSSSSSGGGGTIPEPTAYYTAETDGSLVDVVGDLNFGSNGQDTIRGICRNGRENAIYSAFIANDDAVFNPGTSNGLTMALWFKPDGASGYLAEKAGEYDLKFEYDGSVTFRIATSSTSGWDVSVSQTVSGEITDWHLVIVWIDPGNEIGIFLDGSVDTASLSSGQSAYQAGNDIYIGGSASETGSELVGRFDEIAFFDQALASASRNGMWDGGSGQFWNPDTEDWEPAPDTSSSSSSGGGGGGSSSSSSPSPSSSSSSLVEPPVPPPGGCGCEEESCRLPMSSNPINLGLGQIEMSQTDLGSTAFGSGWGHTRSYSNQLSTSSGGDNGNSWLVSQMAYLQFDAGESNEDIVVIRGTNDSLWFTPDGNGGWEPEFAIRDQLNHDVASKEFVVTRPSGRRMVFFDNDNSHPDALRGQLKSFADPFGLSVSVEYNVQFEIAQVEQTDGNQTVTYGYAYETSGDNIGMLRSVTLRVNGTDVRRAIYDYFSNGDNGGSLNDLKRVSISEYDDTSQVWETLRQTLYWYYIDSAGGIGFAHGLRYEVRPESYAKMVDAGIDPMTVGSGVIADYANKAFQYDSTSRKVTQEVVRGGEETFTYAYEPNTSLNPGLTDYNIWATQTIETRSDGSKWTVYTNGLGRTILSKRYQPANATTGELEKTWFTYTRYNSAGRVLFEASPSAVQSVSEPDPGQGNFVLDVTLKSNEGLITVNNYYPSTNIGLGKIASYLENTGVKEGANGTVTITHGYTYETHTVDGVSIHPMGSRTDYPVAGESGDTTTYSYCWYDSNNSEMGYFGYLPINSDNLGDVSSLTVVEQNQTTYDEASQAVLATNWQRFDDSTGFGPLNGPNDSQPKARRSYMAQWYDGVGRNVASANYGTNGGAVLVRPDVSPERSDTVLVSITRFKDDGEANATIDPMGIETRWENDDAGRRIRLIENYAACGNDPDTNRTTEYAYAPDGGMSRLTLINEVTGNQVTRWVYGTTTEESEVARTDLLRAKIYPESDDTPSPLGDGPDGVYERIEYGYNRQGEVNTMKDPNQTKHAYSYDGLGRQTEDEITSFGAGIDQSVAKIGTTYDTKRLLRTKVTSYDGADAVVNEVTFSYDDFGQLASDQQEHDGAVDGSTLKVQYGYENGNRANTSRRTSMTYPDGRQLNYGYGSNGSAEDQLSRVKTLAIAGEGFDLCTYTYAGAARYVRIAYEQPSVQLTYEKTASMPLGDAGDQYTGYDRFGRTVDMRWVPTGGGSELDRIQYGYDRANNRTWRRNLAAEDGGQDNAYGYDGLYQVKQAALGTLNLNQTAIGAIPSENEDFDYDPTGNWTHYTRSADGTEELDQSRVSNQDNQLTQIDGSSDGISYDKAGNATKMPPNADGDWSKYYQLTWDGWNRLVAVKEPSGQTTTTVALYAYDGIYRRVTKTLGAEVRHYFYNDQWKCVEERVATDSSSSSSSEAPSSSSSSPGGGSSMDSSSSASPGFSSSSMIPGSSGSMIMMAEAVAEVEVQYVWGARPQHRDELILRDRDTSGNGTLDERLYCLMDYFDPTSVVSTAGAVLERYRFSAFGLRTVMDADWEDRSGSNHSFEYAFHGQFLDPETDFYNYGYRYYSSQVGRWISKDPIGEQGGVNIYIYGLNRVVNLVDYLGLKPKKETMKVLGGKWTFDPDRTKPSPEDQQMGYSGATTLTAFSVSISTTEKGCGLDADGEQMLKLKSEKYKYEAKYWATDDDVLRFEEGNVEIIRDVWKKLGQELNLLSGCESPCLAKCYLELYPVIVALATLNMWMRGGYRDCSVMGVASSCALYEKAAATIPEVEERKRAVLKRCKECN